MNNKKCLMAASLLGFSSLVLAGTMGSYTPNNLKVITLSGGVGWAKPGEMQSIYYSPELSRTFTVDNLAPSLAIGEIFAGVQHQLSPYYDGQLGLSFGGASSVKINGDVWDFDDPRFDNYLYSYKIKPARIAVKGKLIRSNVGYSLHPWVSASLGWSSLKANSYNISPKICEVVLLPAANFSNHRNNSFSYTLGAGVQRQIGQDWQIGIGYEFTHWGDSHLAQASIQPLNTTGLTLKHLYTNALMVNLTWLR